MQEVFEKIIYDKVLEKAWQPLGTFDEHSPLVIKVSDVKEIVNQAAAEYNESKILEWMDERNREASVLIEELKRIKNNGWIPCSDESNMPEPYAKILITYKAYDGIKSCEGRYNGRYWYDSAARTRLNAIAWKPLPEPYQPKGE